MSHSTEMHKAFIKAHREVIQGLIIACKFDEAAKEVLALAPKTVWKEDQTFCVLMKRELIECYGVDWKRIVEGCKL